MLVVIITATGVPGKKFLWDQLHRLDGSVVATLHSSFCSLFINKNKTGQGFKKRVGACPFEFPCQEWM